MRIAYLGNTLGSSIVLRRLARADGVARGPSVLERPAPIGSGHTAGPLGMGVAAIGGDLLAGTLGGFDRLEPRAQDPSLVTYAPKIKNEERRIDWRSPAVSVERL